MKMIPSGILFILLSAVTPASRLLAADTTVKLWGEQPAVRAMRFSRLSVYLPSSEHRTGEAVIICPGGSYCYLAMKTEGLEVARWLNSHGICAFVLRYRIGLWGNRHPAMLQDLQQAIAWVRTHASQYGIRRLGVMGFSAGGHLAGMAATFYGDNDKAQTGITTSCSLRPDFAAMIYPVVSMQDSIAHHKSRRNLLGRFPSKEQKEQLSLNLQVHQGMPPLFIAACRDDHVVSYRNSLAMAAAMLRNNLPCEVHIYNKGGHGFGISPKHAGQEAIQWKEAFLAWLRKECSQQPYRQQ